MCLQNNIEKAFQAWCKGNVLEFQNILKINLENIYNFNKYGDIYIYFLPALFIKEIWISLEEINFPIEKIIYYHPEIIYWTQWEEAVKHIVNKDVHTIKDLLFSGIGYDNTYPDYINSDSDNYYYILNYFPTDIKEQMLKIYSEYNSKDHNYWSKIFENIRIEFKDKI